MKQKTNEELLRAYNGFIDALNKVFSGDRLDKLLLMYSTEELGNQLVVAPASGKLNFHSAYVGGYIDHVMNVARNAFKLKKMGFRGGLQTGWKRARQLATRDTVSIQDIKYMRAWFARHVYTSYPTFKAWKNAGRPKDKKWHRRQGIIAWLIWGGDSAFRWIN
jgi:hypothetical protein